MEERRATSRLARRPSPSSRRESAAHPAVPAVDPLTCPVPTPAQVAQRLLRVWGGAVALLSGGLLAYGTLPLLILRNEEQLRWIIRMSLWAVPLIGVICLIALPWQWSAAIRQLVIAWARGQAVIRADCVRAYELALQLPWWVALAAGAASVGAAGIVWGVAYWQARLPLSEVWKGLLAVPLLSGLVGAFGYFGTARALHPILARCSVELRHARPIRRGSLGTHVLTMTYLLPIAVLCLLQPAAYTAGQQLAERYLADRAVEQLRAAAAQAAAQSRSSEQLVALADAAVGRRGIVFSIGSEGGLVAIHPRGEVPVAWARQIQGRLAAGESVWIDRDGEHRVIAVQRVPKLSATVVSISFPADVDLPLKAFLRFSWLAAAGLLGLLLLLGRYFTTSITIPLAELTHAVRRIAERGELTQHVPVTTNDELSEVARAFNRMAERLQTSRADVETYTKRLERSTQDLTALNQEMEDLLRAVSHDLRAPLINIQGFSKRLEPVMQETVVALGDLARHAEGNGVRRDVEALKGVLQTRFGESLRFIAKSVDQMDTLLASLLAVSRVGRKADPAVPQDLDEIVDGVLATCTHLLTERSIRVIRHPLPTDVPCRRNEIIQVFSNLVMNAIAYMGRAKSGVIEIGGEIRAGMAECFVRDTGIGIASADHERIFQMFTRLQAVESPGEGIGLAYVRKVLWSHGGRIWVESRRGQGSTFRFTLPLRAAADHQVVR